MFRWKSSTPVAEDDDDGFSSSKLKQKRAVDSRAELLSGVKPRGAGANGESRSGNGECDPHSENPLRQAELQQLREAAEIRSKEVTQSVNNAVKIAEDTKNIASQTLVSLQSQGDQIRTTTEKTLKLEKELKTGEKLLSKLGPMFTPPWKTKKGAKLQGPSDDYTPSNANDDGSHKARIDLGLDGIKQKYENEEDPEVPVWERERKKQDDGLDAISQALDQLKNMGLGMGQEMDKQDKDLDTLTTNVTELKSRLDQSNKRGKAILRRG